MALSEEFHSIFLEAKPVEGTEVNKGAVVGALKGKIKAQFTPKITINEARLFEVDQYRHDFNAQALQENLPIDIIKSVSEIFCTSDILVRQLLTKVFKAVFYSDLGDSLSEGLKGSLVREELAPRDLLLTELANLFNKNSHETLVKLMTNKPEIIVAFKKIGHNELILDPILKEVANSSFIDILYYKYQGTYKSQEVAEAVGEMLLDSFDYRDHKVKLAGEDLEAMMLVIEGAVEVNMA